MAATSAAPGPPAIPGFPGVVVNNGPASGMAHAALSKLERDALDHYSGTGYNSINGRLRGTFNSSSRMFKELAPGLKQQTALLDAAINKSPGLHKAMTLFRGTSLAAVGGKIPAVGSVLRDKAFLSTSRSQAVASEAFSKGILLRITAPKGTQALDVSHHVGGNEQEILLPRGAKLKVTRVTSSGGKHTIHAKVVK